MEFSNKIKEYEAVRQKERSAFVNIIARIYKFAKPFGLEDPWIEALLAQYNKYQKSA